MKVMKLALLGTAALVVASMGARAENLDTLKAQMDSLTLNAVADAPAAARVEMSVTSEFVLNKPAAPHGTAANTAY